MAALILAFVGLLLFLTLLAVGVKLLWLLTKLVFLPVKLLGAVLGGVATLVVLPIQLAFVLVIAAFALVFVLVFPLFFPLLLVGAILYLARPKAQPAR